MQEEGREGEKVGFKPNSVLDSIIRQLKQTAIVFDLNTIA